MSLYCGKECVCCGKVFTLEDEVVVCPDCGAPHHKACYEATGHCADQEKHGTSQAWFQKNNSAARVSYQTCPRCGARNEASVNTCQMCGERFLRGATPPSETLNTLQTASETTEEGALFGVSPQEVNTFTGRNSAYFLTQFRKIQNNTRLLNWNWSAFLLGFLYLFYRKLYRQGMVLMLVFFVTSIPTLLLMGQYVNYIAPMINIEDVTTIPDAYTIMEEMINPEKNPQANTVIQLNWLVNLMSSIRFGIALAVGFTTNKLYLSKTLQKIKYTRAALPHYAQNPNYLQYLRMMGGVNTGAAVAVLLLCLTLPLVICTAMVTAKIPL